MHLSALSAAVNHAAKPLLKKIKIQENSKWHQWFTTILHDEWCIMKQLGEICCKLFAVILHLVRIVGHII
jgi:hypothetical protein